MKTLAKLCGGYIIFICALLTLAWVAHIKRTSLRKPQILKNVPNLCSHVPVGRQQNLEFIWQHVLLEYSPKLGFSYGRGRRRSDIRYVLGVPTVLRKGKNYLLETLDQIIGKMSKYHRRHCLIVVFIGETNIHIVERIFMGISDLFGPYLDDGLISVIAPPVNYYPDFESLYITLYDEPERAHWRTKQNLDYMFLMTYAQSRGDYYLQLEDDIRPNVGYMDYIDRLASLHSNFRLSLQNWIVLSFSDLGFIGKLFHTEELQPFLDHVKIFYNDQPIDWLMQSYVRLKSCRWNFFHMRYCARDYYLYFIRSSQSQFQHIGLESSLRKKKQKLKDRKFNRNFGKTQMKHLRQPINLIMSHMNTMLLKSNYLKRGESFLWSYMPQESSFLRYMKAHQNDTGQIRIRGGGHNADNFSELIVDVLDEKMLLNREDTKHCGFVLSYTHQTEKDNPYIIYYCISEKNETGWLRRLWSGLSGIF